MSGRQWLAVLAAAVIGGGASAVIASCGEDDGDVQIEGSTTGTTGTGTTGTGTGSVTVDTSATSAEGLERAMAQVTAYARGQTADLVGATVALQKAVDAGSVQQAKNAYAASRPFYERIEPLVALFPELDGKIDAREDDFPKKAKDPTWTGFHPIERMLWHDGRITPRTKVLAAGLVADSRTLQRRMDEVTVTPEVVIPGTAELVDEIEESKITGEEERYSKLDLPTFLANLEGAQEFYDALAPLVQDKDPELADEISDAFRAAFEEVDSLREGGEFPAYDELSDAQQREVKQTIEALAEPLARVQGTLGVQG
ncbi:MAG: EfeM/EfeO family lipoprotein [Thermoleophilaceae bacterium]|nr:EfeM/EfeO family lipoprotein [Thermoleophilaceae bacterium]